MRYRIAVALTLVGTAFMMAISGCTTRSAAADKPAAKRNDSECVFSSSVNDYQPLDNERLIVWAPGRKQPYLLTLSFPSSDLKWGMQLGFEDRDRNGSICGYGFDSVIIPNGMPDRITIGSMTKITPQEAKAYLESARKKPGKKPPPETTR